MKLPRDLSGRKLIQALEKAFGYKKIHQEGSHVILQIEKPRYHRLPIPDHHVLRLGTLNAIIRAVAEVQNLSKEEVLRKLFI